MKSLLSTKYDLDGGPKLREEKPLVSSVYTHDLYVKGNSALSSHFERAFSAPDWGLHAVLLITFSLSIFVSVVPRFTTVSS